jgi:signal transduction histidine kinase
VRQKWLLPTISEIVTNIEGNITATPMNTDERCQRGKIAKTIKAEKEWWSAIAALENLLLSQIAHDQKEQGLVITSPVPILTKPDVLSTYKTATFIPDLYNPLAFIPFQLPPCPQTKSQDHKDHDQIQNISCSLPIIPGDNISSEQFCLVFTKKFSLVLVRGKDHNNHPLFQFSFDPQTIKTAWFTLNRRLLLTTSPLVLKQLNNLIAKFPPVAPDYRLVSQFSRLLLQNLSLEIETEKDTFFEQNSSKVNQKNSKIAYDIELLQALTHEVRTPLTTIHTLTKLILKRQDLAPEIIRRLQIIENECSEQINRMELIFRAVEWQSEYQDKEQCNQVQLTAMSVNQVFQQSIPRWQNSAQRRNLTLDVNLPQKLPSVVSNPTMLDQMLTGLVENFTRNIPSGGHIQMTVTPAGDQLKLQLASKTDDQQMDIQSNCKSIGQILTFQPETGSISLNMNVTKNLFQALGGKLIVRQKSEHNQILTIFLPLC